MALELDTRQRAMLQEMGVHVWLPEAGVVTLQQAAATDTAHPTATPAAHHPEARGPARSAQVKEETTQWAGDTEQNALVPSLRAPNAPTARTQTADLPDTASLHWPALAEAVRQCQACALCTARSKASILPLADTLPCDWMVVSDPPDEDEDHAGAPFAGPDGQLLANMLRALGLQQANLQPGAPQDPPASPAQRAYVSHVLKCRPAHGAVPKPAELAQCAAYLQREIALVQPKVILAMGRFAIQVLLGDTPAQASLPLGKQRGAVHRYQGVPVVVTYHPKALMRNNTDKAKAWADMCLAADTLTNRTDE
jgi:uracil-DNA glycosylase